MKLQNKILIALLLGLMSLSAFSASTEGVVTSTEYQLNTDSAEGSDKRMLFNWSSASQQHNDEAKVQSKATPVPIPSTLFLLAPALAGFLSLRKRKKH
jgi:hypothetical protein